MASELTIRSLPPQPGPDPLDVLSRLCDRQAPALAMLHSAAGEGQTVLAFDPLLTVHAGHDAACPLPALDQAIRETSFAPPHPLVGWLGFVSYDIGRTLEHIPVHTADDLRWPLLHFALYRHYVLFDHATRLWTPVALDGDPADARRFLTAEGRATPAACAAPTIVDATPVHVFHQHVLRVKEYIAAGDIYQANLAQRWVVRTAETPHDIFRRLCAASPAPYAAFLGFTDAAAITRHVLSASPELFLNVSQRHVVTRPIKGTRRRDPADAVRDAALRDELLASTKDRAELAMIVDLLRNDLGRVSRYGSVRVTGERDMERHPTVWHTVATVESELRPEASLADLLAAVCPGGSITGAPKIRAMQIIEELEGFRRGLYCGNIGVIGPAAESLTLNIAIRTILMQEGRAHVFAGGGVVSDSDPQGEYEETLHKASAMFRALRINPSG